MKPSYFKTTSDCLLLCVFLLWWVGGETVSHSTTSPPVTLSPRLTTKSPPRNADAFKAIKQDENSITLQWGKVDDFTNYTLAYEGKEESVTAPTHTVRNLRNGTEYTFTLYTVFGNVKSSGVNLTAVTAPRNADAFKAIKQDENSITLQWGKVDDFTNYNLTYGGKEESVTAPTHTVLNLTSGTEYTFTLYTVFGNVKSSGVNLTAVTAPRNADAFKAIKQDENSITLQWGKVDSFTNYTLAYGGKEESVTGPTYTVQNLRSGTEYTFTLYTVFGNVKSRGVNLTAVTAPRNVDAFKAIKQDENSITLQWGKVDRFTNYTLAYGGKEESVTGPTHTVRNLTSGTEYTFTLYTVFGNVKSRGVNLTAVTAPRNADAFKAIKQDENSITLQWGKVDSFTNYTLAYGGKEESVTGPTYTVQNLRSGTEYTFTLYTVFGNVKSRGVNLTAVTAPRNADAFKAIKQDENSITLQWGKADDFTNYTLTYGGKEESVTGPTYTVPNLRSGTEYTFTLYTVFGNVKSSGVNLTAVTDIPEPTNFQSIAQDETSITLQWETVQNYTIYNLRYGEEERIVTASPNDTEVTYIVPNLRNGTEYNFTLYTVSGNVKSSGVNLTAFTAPSNADGFKSIGQDENSITLQWEKVGSLTNYTLTYEGKEESVTAPTHKVQNLTSGTEYTFTLYTVFGNVKSSGVNLTAVTAPRNTDTFEAIKQDENSITLQWGKVDDFTNYTLAYGGKEESVTGPTHTVRNLRSGTEYTFTLYTVFGNVKSSGVNLTAVTAPRNADAFEAIKQDENSITLQWGKVDDLTNYTLAYGGKEESVTAPTHTIQNLTSGTKYNFTLYTVFENVKSRGVNLTAVTAPRNTEKFQVIGQTETSITLQWVKVDKISHYTLMYGEEEMNVSAEDVIVTIQELTSGTKYTFTLFTVFENVNSSGLNLIAATEPSTVTLVRVTECSATRITLTWKVAVDKDWSYFLQMNGEEFLYSNSSMDIIQSISSLKPGTSYPFSVTTMFFKHNSTAYEDFAVTAINCTSIPWRVTNSSIRGTVQGLFTNATASNKSHTQVSPGGIEVSFTGLYPGATYDLLFEYKKQTTKCVPMCSSQVTTIPPNLNAHCENWASGYSLYIEWNKPNGVWTAVEVNVTGKTVVKEGVQQHIIIPGFQPAQNYKVSLASMSGPLRSEPIVFWCPTDARGVIAGSVCAVLLFIALVCLIVIFLLKRPDIIRKKSFIGGSKQVNTKSKAIPVAEFPDHFNQLSGDENRGFSQEYESLSTVGTEQTRKEAERLDNKPRNRFTNVLPYDWCRVKLLTSNPNETSDYINANYMPGYNSNREYIAAQGPLPTTVNDFWRMIWEQKVKGIAMVTNCTEGGRTKCEQYWPPDSEPRLYGKLSVTMKSEQQEAFWTLREFRVKHSNTSEERTVKHFHFTAWPDHGVPQGTEFLIQFRGLMRHHIQTEGTGAPTVVHCSAGVGRTGTLIALDVLLQQLEKEKAVGIKSFVNKMRLSRPLMVQTESQYIFLHQCIMDSLQPNEKTEDNIYENADMIYANATALREFHRNA